MGIGIGNFGRWLAWLAPAPPFITFWHGPVDPITYTCLASFPRRGVGLRVYSYDPAIELPEGVQRADARRIVPDEELLGRFSVDGQASLSAFSDYFRYLAIKSTGSCWVDSDVVCLRRPTFGRNTLVFGYQGRKCEGPWALNGAVLKLPRRHPMLRYLCASAALAVDADTRWGTIGPLLVTQAARRYGVVDSARPAGAFYPIGFTGFWKMLLPERKAEVRRGSAESQFLHLWRESYRRAGYDETIAPPEGSYLHDLCGKLGTLDRFRRTYGREELRAILSAHVRD